MAATDLVSETLLDSLSAAIAGRYNTLKGKVGDLTALTTTVKTSLVAAINELDAAIDGLAGGGAISDGTTGTGTTWSSSKVNQAINDAVAALNTTLTTGAPGALDTLDELAAALGDDANFASTITNALAVRLRVDTGQGLTSPQQAQGRANLGIVTSTADFAAAFNTATA